MTKGPRSVKYLEMRGIVKTFPGVQALRGIDLEIKGGEVHALLGANGAGKSTLVKILSGAYIADRGKLIMDGKELNISSPSDAIQAGIRCVYQEVDTALVPQLSVAENIMMDRIIRPQNPWIQWGKIVKEAETILAQLGHPLDVYKKITEISLSEKQLVLIARAIVQEANVLIFDEPTAPLSTEETNRLFRVIEQLKSSGVACIFISHRLSEVFQICDRITVMRDGQIVSTKKKEETNIPRVIEEMLGKTFAEEYPKRTVPIGAPLMEARNLSRDKVRNVHLTVHEGEIVGIVGLVGAGKTELSKLLFGADSLENGEIRMRGKQVTIRHPREAVRAGIVLIPEERRKEGILVEETVRKNLTLPSIRKFSPLGFLKAKEEIAHSTQMVREIGIKTPTVHEPVGRLSGGNQQKVVVGKWLPMDADVFLLDEPTKGIDIGAKSELFRLIGDLASKGKGIIYFSCEFSEVMGIADRILVMCDGQIVKEFTREAFSQDTLLYFASGGREADERENIGSLL